MGPRPGGRSSSAGSYYDAGNVKSITDTSRSGTDTQCFTYDHLQRLTEAWTPTGGCTGAPDKALLGGPAPYWTSYAYDSTGNRTSETQHGVGAMAADTTRTYHYPDPGQGQHRLSSVTQTGAAGSRTDSYDYDTAGDTTTRDIASAGQTLAWDTEGHLATTTDSTGTTTYAYDAGGSRLLRRDPTSTTLYLPDMELRLDKTTNTVSGTRYYTHGGTLVAVGTASGIEFQSADPHGSAELSVNGSTQALAQRRFGPFGQFRGSPTGIWPMDKGFVGGTIDPSGLTNLGARQYDPDTGRFVSADPLMDLTDLQSWNGYAYADNNPVNSSDPSGEMVDCATGHGGCGTTGNAGGSKTPGNCDDGQCDNWGRQSSNREIIAQPGNHFPWKPEPPRCGFSCFARNFANGAVDGGLRAAVGLGLQLPGGQVGLDGACALFSVQTLCGNPADHIHVPLGGDVDDPGYKLGAGAGEYALPLLIPGVGEEADVAQGGRALPRLARALRKSRCNSFVAGTLVLMADGTAKAIEKVKVGDQVAATDPKTGKTRSEPVVASFGGTGYKNLVKVTVDTDGKRGHRTGLIIATEHHKFWDPSRHAWTRADRLASGSKLSTPGSGEAVRVVSATRYPGHPTVRDLTIANLHTYYVQAGDTPVLVHNCGEEPLNGSGPRPGVLELSGRVKSSAALKNFSPNGERDFVFDPTTGRFANEC